MLSTIVNILLAIVVLGVLVFVHEFGHFFFSKVFRVPVEAFALGFGPSIIKFKRRETTYRLNIFPLGGYAKIGGMESDEEVDHGFYSQAPWKRFLILAGGVLFNLIFAWLLIFLVAIFSPVAANNTIVGEVLPNYPAAQVGMQSGDRVLSINGNPVDSWDQETGLIEKLAPASTSLVFRVARGERQLELTITPTFIEAEKRWMVGIGPSAEYLTFGQAFLQSFVQFGRMISLVFVSLGMLFTGQASIGDFTGPVGIIQYTAQFAQSGFFSLLWFMAFLSLNLGVLNFLPIPAFDGGRLIFLLIEWISGRRVNRRVEETIHTIGFFLLIALIVYITIQDVRRLW